MKVKRLQIGDEHLGIVAVVRLKSEDEREGHKPSNRHMGAFLAHDENYLIVASDGDMPVGFLVAYQMPMVARDASMVYLYEIGVAPEYQRQGIATEMIDLLKSLCKARDVVEIWVGTSNDNTAAKQLYACTGAILEGEDNAESVYTRESLAA